MAMTLKVKRIIAGLTQKELAEKAGVSRITISTIERGEAESVTVGTLKKLAKALDCKASDFLDDEV